jgi:hypothetical protein
MNRRNFVAGLLGCSALGAVPRNAEQPVKPKLIVDGDIVCSGRIYEEKDISKVDRTGLRRTTRFSTDLVEFTGQIKYDG